ncbi:MAG: GGDEF domain-containing protein [Candidatus Omnitrophica bacterium]|nr:GGDEF domain-containing protein [Candidatus Omnitrophota bacterium]
MNSRRYSLIARITDNIRAGVTLLKLPGDSEKAFLQYYYKRTINQTRFALFAAIFLYESVAFIDPYIVPSIIGQVRALRFLIVLPAILTSFIVSLLIRKDAIVQFCSSVSVIVAGVCIVLMMHFDSGGLGSFIYHEGLLLTIIYGYTFLRLRLKYAVICGWVITVVYIYSAIVSGTTAVPMFINNALFTIIANFIGMFVAYMLELNLRSEYLSATAMKRTHKGLQKLSLFDDLTGIANRRLFDLRLTSEFQELSRSGKPLSLIMADVDLFKMYNDTFGHLAGDDCLVKIAKKLQQCATRAGDLAVRYGGEEFAVVLSDTPSAGAKIVAEKIREEVRGLGIHNPSAPGALITLSLGVATVYPSRQNSVEALIKAADDALYRAKKNGRNRVEFA